jgi:hypothetical protein
MSGAALLHTTNESYEEKHKRISSEYEIIQSPYCSVSGAIEICLLNNTKYRFLAAPLPSLSHVSSTKPPHITHRAASSASL